MSRFLVTGAAGFIGYHVAQRLLAEGHQVVGLDNLNSYYDVSLKETRLEHLRREDAFSFAGLDLGDQAGVDQVFDSGRFDGVVNMAAQAGVRYSLANPSAYVDSNIVGFLHILEACRRVGVKHLLFASSSSVYGANTKIPFAVEDRTDHPISLYAATKKSNELMAHCYATLFGVPCTGVRLFTVYGPWGRPDMALFSFVQAILEGRTIDLFNRGRHKRDFTYISDVVDALYLILQKPPQGDETWPGEIVAPASSRAPYRLLNVGSQKPIEVLEVVRLLEIELGRKARTRLLPLQPGDLPDTHADVSDLQALIGQSPQTPTAEGVRRFVKWYLDFYGPRPAPASTPVRD